MKFIYALILSLATFATSLHAQNIFNDLRATKDGQGTVTVSQSYDIKRLLDKKQEAWANKKQLTYAGYRVQVYMGNHQKQSKDDATEREKSIKEKHPELSTYLTFSSPFWKLRVGDFRTFADALVLANTLKSEFYKWTGDIYIVRDSEVFNPDFENTSL